MHNRIGRETYGALTLDRWMALAVALAAIGAVTTVATAVDAAPFVGKPTAHLVVDSASHAAGKGKTILARSADGFRQRHWLIAGIIER